MHFAGPDTLPLSNYSTGEINTVKQAGTASQVLAHRSAAACHLPTTTPAGGDQHSQLMGAPCTTGCDAPRGMLKLSSLPLLMP